MKPQEPIPFDENITNIEDRFWAKEVLENGYRIIYEPEARVFHYHGIHQNQNFERGTNVVRILENLNLSTANGDQMNHLDLNSLEVRDSIGLRFTEELMKQWTVGTRRN